MDYLRQQKISIHRLALEHADIYAYKNKDGIANWDITVPDTVQSTSSPAGDAMNISELDIRQIFIQHATVTMDDRDTRIFANLWDTNLTLKANMKKGHSMLIFPLMNDLSRKIIHIDMDAFFAAVEIRDNPKLKGKPVIIGSDPRKTGGRGVVSTCSYEARAFGIHSAAARPPCPSSVS